MNKSKSSLFLMELILAILIFSIAGAVCIQIFVKAHIISQDTQHLNRAVTLCQSGAELFYGFKGDISQISETLDKNNTGTLSDGILKLYYDSDFKECAQSDATYELEILSVTDNNMIRGEVSVYQCNDESVIYSLSCSYFNEPDPLVSGDVNALGGAL